MTAPTIQNTNLSEKLSASFDRVPKQNAVLTATRLEALARFEALGFPSTRNEEWKYTSLKPALSHDYDLDATGTLAEADLRPVLMPDGDGLVLVFVNGTYQPAFSRIRPSDGIMLMTFGEALEEQPALVEKYFAQIAGYQNDALTALNTAFAREGVFIHVPDGKTLEHPVYLYFISDGRQAKPFSQPRNLVVVGRGGAAKLVEVFHTIGENSSFTNAVTEISVGENASVEYYKMQDESENAHHVGTTQAHLSRDSRFAAYTISLKGALLRNNLNLVLDGSNVEAHMYGLYLLDGTTHTDNHTLADHRQPNSYSNELYKGILDGKSTGVFNGKVFVRQAAQKTNAFQSNRNLVLSREASMNTKPQLEIFADDVKCSHGATVGQLDEDMLFYLRTRGIPAENARALLMRAFAEDVLTTISIAPFKEYVERFIAQRLD